MQLRPFLFVFGASSVLFTKLSLYSFICLNDDLCQKSICVITFSNTKHGQSGVCLVFLLLLMWIMPADVYKELELDALSSTISTLNARLRRSTQFTAAKSSVTKKQAPGTRRNHLLENQMTQLKSSMEKLSIVNSENSEKVKLVESALAGMDHGN